MIVGSNPKFELIMFLEFCVSSKEYDLHHIGPSSHITPYNNWILSILFKITTNPTNSLTQTVYTIEETIFVALSR